MKSPFQDIEDARALAQAIVDTVRGPLLVLDSELRVVSASRSFYQTFLVKPEAVEGRLLFDLGDGQWDIPALRTLLEKIIPERVSMDAFEVAHDFPGVGPRSMLLNARKVFYEAGANTTILLAFEDVTERRLIEREKEELLKKTRDLLREKDVLLEEIQHRVANSLQIIASILLLKARNVTSDETRQHLQDAHRRVMSVAAVQQHLQPGAHGELIEMDRYLAKLCESLSNSMIGENRSIELEVQPNGGRAVSAQAVSLGLIVTELVINALKYAFPAGRPGGKVLVNYEVNGDAWRLTVSDNGVGKTADEKSHEGGGLGTALITALSKQLDALVEISSGANGMSVSVTHAVFVSPLAQVVQPRTALSA